jgi:hypothetical protein
LADRWPTFLIVGAARSGTTALYTFLGRHPGIFAPRLKEPQFFAFRGQTLSFRGPGDDETINRRGVTDEATYRALFAGARPDQQVGEASVSSLYYPQAPLEIGRCIPDARIVVILRDPVERAFSNYQYMLATVREPASTFSEALAQEEERVRGGWQHIWHYRRLGYYHTQLKRFYEVFRREQIHVLLHEDLLDNPRETLGSLCAFLGLTPMASIDTARPINVSGRPRSPALARFLVRSSPLKRAVLALVPTTVRVRLVGTLRTNLLQRETIPAAVAAELRREYRPEIVALENLIERDLGSWLSPSE